MIAPLKYEIERRKREEAYKERAQENPERKKSVSNNFVKVIAKYGLEGYMFIMGTFIEAYHNGRISEEEAKRELVRQGIETKIVDEIFEDKNDK